MYTNHCIRATLLTTLHRAQVNYTNIQAVSGHKSVDSLSSYISGPDQEQVFDMSNILHNLCSGRKQIAGPSAVKVSAPVSVPDTSNEAECLTGQISSLVRSSPNPIEIGLTNSYSNAPMVLSNMFRVQLSPEILP